MHRHSMVAVWSPALLYELSASDKLLVLGLRDAGSNCSWIPVALPVCCAHLEWDSASLGISEPPLTPHSLVCGLWGGVLTPIKYSTATSSIFLFYAFRVAVYF